MTFQSAQALSILDSLSDGLLVQTVPTGGVVHVNPGFLNLLVCDRDRLNQHPDGWMEHIYLDDQPSIRQWWQQLITHPITAEQTYRILSPSGQLRWIQCRSVKVQPSPEASPCLATLHVDVTQQQRPPQIQPSPCDVLQTVMGQFLMGVACCLAGGQIVWSNDAFCQILGHPPGALTHKRLQDLITPASPTLTLGGWPSPPVPQSQELELINRSGQIRWILTTIVPLAAEEQPSGSFLCLIQDITQYKQAETELRASLKETEVLVAEIHHRVKNNLQIISSLLELQATRTQDANAKSILLSSQDRVLAMSLIHETLYQSNNLTQIDFAVYIRQLVGGLSRAYLDHRSVNFTLNLDTSLIISTNLAVPLGLILNELVTNALKHSFSKAPQGTLIIDLQALASGDLQLTVREPNGCLPEDFSMHHSSSMGLQIVTLLTQKIQAQLAVNHQPTTFQIVFAPGIPPAQI
jgi:PAS domain S-box-containing protein